MSKNKNSLKLFFIKLSAITFAIIIIINVSYNLIIAERMEKIDNVLNILDRKNKIYIKDKIYKEINKGLEKEEMLNQEDKIIILKVYKKLKKEFDSLNIDDK